MHHRHCWETFIASPTLASFQFLCSCPLEHWTRMISVCYASKNERFPGRCSSGQCGHCTLESMSSLSASSSEPVFSLWSSLISMCAESRPLLLVGERWCHSYCTALSSSARMLFLVAGCGRARVSLNLIASNLTYVGSCFLPWEVSHVPMTRVGTMHFVGMVFAGIAHQFWFARIHTT